MEVPRPFRAIIVSGGMVGLTAAHIFSQAGINFLILEKHDSPLCRYGAGLAMWPQTIRVLDQLGLLEALMPNLDFLEETITSSSDDGRARMAEKTFDWIEQNHGHRMGVVAQAAKSRILFNKRVADFEVSDSGVKVVCDGGDTIEGSFLIGADEARSRFRLLVESLRTGTRPEDLPHAVVNPYTAVFRLCVGTTAGLPGLPPKIRYDGSGDGLSTQLMHGKLEPLTSESRKYTEKDKEDFLARMGHLYVAPGWTFREVYAKRVAETSFINLEEGLNTRLFFQRVVIVGDALRKLEPPAGLGWNCDVSDIVVLANGLRGLLKDGKSPSTQDLESLFETYQTTRVEEAKKVPVIASRTTRVIAWLDWKARLNRAKYLLPNISLSKMFVNKFIAPMVSLAPVLEWLEEKTLPASGVPWRWHPVKQE
ncbi:putative monooxygenase [Hypoxylon sp. FL1150]|nr:putative monooxygenase [Hypoxylon sp. FL1150]